MATITTAAHPIHYPERDGKPMAETDVHIDVLIFLREALKDYFRDEPQVYIAGNMLLYYEEGNPAACVAPDIFVVQGVSKGERLTYKLWEEGQRLPSSSRSPHVDRAWKIWAPSGPSTPCWGYKSIFCMIHWASICGHRCKATGCSRASTSACSLETKGNLSARR